jgi:enterochelin esterase-like enzyme
MQPTRLLCATFLVSAATAFAQAPAPVPPAVSPEVSADRKITFRLLAPQAESVKLSGSDLPENGKGTAMVKNQAGVWEVTLGPVPAGAYRYNFNVNGVPVVDPRNPQESESNTNVWSLVVVPGSNTLDVRQVPHGAVASVTYYSTALGKFRRMHVYTPPGYESGKGKYPVFYLLHGSSDSDSSWSSVGRAGFILDNLIADGRAKPMIVVMPAGHTAAVRRPAEMEEVVRDFGEQILPYVEKNYRVMADKQHRAIAGLSMGGHQTLDIFAKHPDLFAYVGVFSSGLIGFYGPPRPNVAPRTGPSWEESHKEFLADPAAKKGLKLFWFATGKEDSLLLATLGTVEMYQQHGFSPVSKQSDGGHTWLNWRDYLTEFVPQLFQ